MTRTERNLLAAIGFIVTLLSLRIVAAQTEPSDDDATVLVLAISAVAEAGFDAHSDHAAIWHVLAKRADRAGITVDEMAVRYVSAWKVSDERTRWVRGLRLDARRPEGWPLRLSWSAHVPRWLRVIERARAFVAGEVADPCRASVVHWGARSGRDMERATRAGMVLARCSAGTRNAFWRLR